MSYKMLALREVDKLNFIGTALNTAKLDRLKFEATSGKVGSDLFFIFCHKFYPSINQFQTLIICLARLNCRVPS